MTPQASTRRAPPSTVWTIKRALLQAVFASDVGVDDPPLATKDRGFVWFEVTKVEPPRERPLDEVKDQVAKQWRDDEVAKALSAKAGDMVQKLNAGATLASLAEAEKLEAKTAADLHRRGAASVNESVVAAVFNTPPTGAGSAATPEGRARLQGHGRCDPADRSRRSPASRLCRAAATKA